MAEQSPTEDSAEFEQKLLRKDLNALMRHMKILGRDKQSDILVTITNFQVDRPCLKYSEPFYTHPCGYKLCLLAQISTPKLSSAGAAGADTSQPPRKMFGVFACLMQGEFDRELSLPIKGRVTIQLTNQVRDADHLKRSKQVQWQHWPQIDPSPIPVITDVTAENLYSSSGTKYVINGCLQFNVRLAFIE